MAKSLMNASEMAQKSWEARKEKYGSAEVTEKGRMGGTKTRDRHGSDYYKRIGAIGYHNRQVRLQEMIKREIQGKSSLDRFANFITGQN